MGPAEEGCLCDLCRMDLTSHLLCLLLNYLPVARGGSCSVGDQEKLGSEELAHIYLWFTRLLAGPGKNNLLHR